MSSDYFDDNDNVDYSAFVAEVDAIEAAHAPQPKSAIQDPPTISNEAAILDKNPRWDFKPKAGPSHLPQVLDVDVDDQFDNYFDDFDSMELEKIDLATEAALKTNNAGFASLPPPGARKTIGLTRQLTLTGEILHHQSRSRPPLLQGPSKVSRNPSCGSASRKVKAWDYTAFSKTGWKSGKRKPSKRKGNGNTDMEEDVSSSNEFEQFPLAKKYNISEPPPFKHKFDPLDSRQWIYPTNKPKRDYQFNIARKSLFENTLVALPTGLGKTFIAGVVMLNYYRWFPDGKIVFVAPTKPLVAQQREACHKSCGIPADHAVVLTGEVSRQLRTQAWMEKRVFYMTPQTLMNDLKTETCNSTDIILLVVDEAHKATGDYAYCQVVRYLMATNGKFRILALTATPGSKPEAVQSIVDSLRISHIEIRDENSLDLRQYILPKKISIQIVKMSPEVIKIRDMLAGLMRKIGKRLFDSNLCPNMDMLRLHHYRCNALMMQYGQDGTARRFPWVFSLLKKLSCLARVMGYLLECSIAICYSELQSIVSGVTQDEKKPAHFGSEPLLFDIIHEMERLRNGGFPLHPKMEKLEAIAIDYFAQTANTIKEDSSPDATCDSKMMVFTNFRASVDEIVTMLNKQRPLIRAARFIGQGVDKRGNKGIGQKAQLEVIKQFKEGIHNVLVATSIGEEGLDIGEIDMIICYDAQKTPIRMLQRIGRTGRKRAGRVEVLLSEAREETNWDKAKSDYESVQASIIRGDSIELFGDVPRLLPDTIQPTCVEMQMPIYEYVGESVPTKAPRATSTGTKRKRNDDPMRNIPEGTCVGFVPSSKLVRKPSRPYKRLKAKASNAGENRSTEGEGENPSKGSNNLSRVKKPSRGKQVRNRKLKAKEMTLSQLDRELQDDSDDLMIEEGITVSSPARDRRSSRSEAPTVSQSERFFSKSPEASLESSCRPHDDAWLFGSDEDAKRANNYKTGMACPGPALRDGSPSCSSSPVLLPKKLTHTPRALPETQEAILQRDGSTEPPISALHVETTNKHYHSFVEPQVFLDVEAEVSGGEASSSGLEDVEDESDRRFAGDFHPTQAPRGYNQTNAYRHSLMTQASTRGDCPQFTSRPIRPAPFGRDRHRRPVQASSSPGSNVAPDQYSIDSFVVEDDDDILYRVETESSAI